MTLAVEGLAVPWGKVGVRNGRRYSFERGSIMWGESRVVLRAQHDPATLIGRVTKLTDTAEGLWMRAAAKRTPAVLRILARTVISGKPLLSIGLADDTTWELRGDIWYCVRGRLVEISLTPDPAFRFDSDELGGA